MGLIYKYEDGDSVTKKMVNRNKPKENKTISKSERSNSESTSVSKPLVKSLKVLAIEKMMRDEKEQPVISQGRKLTEQEQKTSDKINKRLENKAKYKNEPGIVNDFLNVTGIDPTDIGMTAGNIAKKISNLGGEGLTEEDIIKTTNNPKEALKFADNIAKQEAISLIAGNILAAPLSRAYYNTASSINKYVKNPFPSIRNFKKLHPLVTNSRLLDPALANKLIRKYPQISGDIVGNTTADIGDNIVKKLNTELSEAEFNPNKILDKVKQSAEKSELLERFSESVPQKKDALNELKLIKDIQSNLKHAEVESSMGDHIAKVHGKYYDTNKLSTEEYDLLERAALNSPEQLAAYHTSYTPKETDAIIDRGGSLRRSDFVTSVEEQQANDLFNKYSAGVDFSVKGKPKLIDDGGKKFNEMMKEAKKLGLPPDEILSRVLKQLADVGKPKLKYGEQGFTGKPFYLNPKNPRSSTRAVINSNSNYNPFAKELNETGPLGGKYPGELNSYYADRINTLTDQLQYADNDLMKIKIQNEINKIYQQGLKEFKLGAPYKSNVNNIILNKKGGLIYKK